MFFLPPFTIFSLSDFNYTYVRTVYTVPQFLKLFFFFFFLKLFAVVF